MADLVVDTVALRRAATDLRSVVGGIGQMHSKVGSWCLSAEAAGKDEARRSVHDLAARWTFGLGILRDEAASLAFLLSRAAATYEAVEASLTGGSPGHLPPVPAEVGRDRGLAPAAPAGSDGKSVAPIFDATPGSWSSRLESAGGPRGLIPGDPARVEELAAQARRFAMDAAHAAGDMRALSLGTWVGAAADAIVAEAGDLPSCVVAASEAFDATAGALFRYAASLEEAQATAHRALQAWSDAKAAARARAVTDPFADMGLIADPRSGPGAEQAELARRLLSAADDHADSSAAQLALSLRDPADRAPDKPGFWATVSHLAGQAANAVGTEFLDLGASTVNALASLGSAAARHPEDLLVTAAGIALMAVSAGGEAGGLVLTATGVGAVAGAPLAAVSAAGLAAGAGIAYMGAGDLAEHAAGDDRVSPVEHPAKPSEPTKSNGELDDLFDGGTRPKASELDDWARSQGWTRSQTEGGPPKYTDENDVVRLTIKQGSSRAPGSEQPHVEIRDAAGQRTDPFGNAVVRKSPGNHTPIDWDW